MPVCEVSRCDIMLSLFCGFVRELAMHPFFFLISLPRLYAFETIDTIIVLRLFIHVVKHSVEV